MELKRDHENRELKSPASVRVVVRRDGVAVSADVWYYEFVQTGSARSLLTFIDTETAEEIKAKIEEVSEAYASGKIEPGTLFAEYLTYIDNDMGMRYENIYLRMESTELTEDGKPLYQFTIMDLVGVLELLDSRRDNLEKYRLFMTLKDEIYFDYNRKTNNLCVYKYVNGNAVVLYNQDFDEFTAEVIPMFSGKDPLLEARMNGFADLVRTTEIPFDYKMDLLTRDGKIAHARALGGIPSGQKHLLVGVFYMEKGEHEVPYYMKPAAKDPGTGLLNKRAGTEYALDKLNTLNGKTAWVMIIDIDDFKSINDNFGHLFGDEVIRYVADTLRVELSGDGFVSRFGGDEFFVFADRIPTRDALKNFLKVVSKKLLIHFDPKFKLTISVGASCYPKDGATLEELFAKADKGLYIAKEKGKNRHIIYDPELHGPLEEGSMQSQAAAYALTREAARAKMVELMSGIVENGSRYLLQNKKLQKELRTLFDIDGFTVATVFEDVPLVRDGKYISDINTDKFECVDPSFMPRQGNLGRYVANNLLQIKEDDENAYLILKEQEIEACIFCIYFKNEKPAVLVGFDIFNKTRKWSDRDIDMLTEVGVLVCSMIVKEHS
jgi:diguanylate cyclase (GGDEF)-like protein